MKPEAFFYDNQDLGGVKIKANVQFLLLQEHLSQGGVIVFPADGIGTGLARLEETAPAYLAYINDLMAVLHEIAGKEKGA